MTTANSEAINVQLNAEPEALKVQLETEPEAMKVQLRVDPELLKVQLKSFAGPKGEPGEPGPAGATGPQGPAGTGLDIKGTYGTLAGLEAAVTDPAQGDMYNVGTDAPYTIYMWNTTQSPGGWISQGALQGVKGDKGDPGEAGPSGPEGPQGPSGADGKDGVSVTHAWNGTTLIITSASGTSSADLKGEKGDPGDVAELPLSDSAPLALGAATPGTSGSVSRADHVHSMPSAGDVGARPSTWTPTAEDVGARPSTWTPTAEDVGALPSGGTAADSSKLGGKAPEYYIQPQNLLDNSNFTNPVNQRGSTSYSASGYTLDRWYCGSGSLTVSGSAGYLSLNNTDTATRQYLQQATGITGKAGHVYTVACYDRAAGEAVAFPVTIPDEGNYVDAGSISGGTLRIENSASVGIMWRVMVNQASTVMLDWAALYEGEYTADNLPPYVPKGYETELLKCQRYYYQWKNSTGVIAGFFYSSTIARAMIETPVPMRAAPTVTIDGYSETAFYPGGMAPQSAPTISAYNGRIVTLQFAVSGATAYAVCVYKSNGKAISLSADL